MPNDPLEDAGGKPPSNDKQTADKPPTGDPADLSSLDNLKGKTLDDDTFAELIETVSKTAEAAADKRTTAAQKKWQSDLDRRLKAGELHSEDAFQERWDKAMKDRDRRDEARNQLVDTLAEHGIKAKKGTKKYDEFSKAYQEGIERGDWTPAILVTEAGVKTVIKAGGLIEEKKEGSDDKRGHRLPPGGQRVRAKGDETTDKLTPDEARKLKMQEAVEGLE